MDGTGAVQVCQDLNGNGVPDPEEPWYELAGSDYWLSTTKRNAQMTYYNPNYDKRYTVPWTLKYTDKDGKEQMEAGAVLTNQFHQQSYYPDPFDFGCDRDSVTFRRSYYPQFAGHERTKLHRVLPRPGLRLLRQPRV